MLKSMTGYGKEMVAVNEKTIVAEVRTLNSRTLDANLRLPADFREQEIEIRSLLASHIGRGKVDFYLTVENDAGIGSHHVNKPLAVHYLNEAKEIAKIAGMELNSDVLPAILRLPDVIGQANEEIPEDLKKAILSATLGALKKADEFRIHEGDILAKDFANRITTIADLLKSIESFENERITTIRQRLRSDLAQLETNIKVDENRFEQELIYYLEKLDFAEEKLRLRKHCDHFLQTMLEPESQGRKLGFMVQEIGREINTLGSKANNSDIQQIVVQMKDELEKIKEQLLNIL